MVCEEVYIYTHVYRCLYENISIEMSNEQANKTTEEKANELFKNDFNGRVRIING